mgnify:CR=1 FL=1
MINIDVTFFFQLVNFLIILILLNWVLIKPIREIIKKRQDHMDGMLVEAESFASDAEEKLKNYEAALAEARAAGTEERMKMKDKGVAEEQAIVGAATAEAQEVLQSARKDVTDQVKAAMDTLKGQVDAFADKAVGKVLG